MPTIIDALVVTLTMDPSGFKRGSQQAQTEQKKLKDSISALDEQIASIRRRSTKETAAQDRAQIASLREVQAQKKKSLSENKSAEQEALKRQKEQTEGLDKLKLAAVEMFAVFTAGASLKSFITDLVVGDAAIGRMSANLGESAQTATAFGAVIASLGGKASEGIAAFQTLAGIRFAEQVKGDYSAAPLLSRLGVQPSDLNNLDSALAKIAASAKTMKQADFYQFTKALGFSDATINALELGNVELAKRIELAKQREGLDTNWITLSQQIVTWLANTRDALAGVARTTLPEFISAFQNMGSAAHDLAVSLGFKSILGDANEWKEFARELTALFNGLAASTRSLADIFNALNDAFHGDMKGAGAWIGKAMQDGATVRSQLGSAFSDQTGAGGKGPTAAPNSSGGAIGGNSSLADRNNNPGNLTDGRGHLLRFPTREAGFQAMRDQILRDAARGQTTVSSLINDPRHGWSNQWAPGNSAKSTANYIASVSKALGVSPNQSLNFSDPNTLRRLMMAMSAVERGGSGIDPALATGAGAAFAGNNTNIRNSSVKTDVQIGKIEVVAPQGSNPAQFGERIADSVRKQPFVAMANYGLA